MPMQPTIGPISVPRPPTMTQMMICADCARPKIVGLTKVAPIGEQAAGKSGQRAADGEGRELVGARVIAQQFGAPLVFPDADDDAAEAARQQQPQPEIGREQRGGRQIEHAFEIDRRALVAGEIERRDAGNAVEAAEPRRADMEFRPGRRIDPN